MRSRATFRSASSPARGARLVRRRVRTEGFVSAELFEATRRWGRWGEDDERGALNLLTPERVTKAAALVRDGLTVPCGRPLARAPAVDNPNPALHHMIQAGDFAATQKGFQWAGD